MNGGILHRLISGNLYLKIQHRGFGEKWLEQLLLLNFSLLTAVANDLGYEQVFAEPLRRRMIKEDMLVAISSSGMSPNVLLAARDARELGGFVVTLSAMKPGNKLRSLGRINFYLPAETYGMAETCHAAILHFWMDQLQI